MKHTLSLLFAFLFCASAFGQSTTIKGFVYERGSGEPVIYTNVYLEGTGYGVQTDVNGYYSLTGIPAGTYTLFTTQIGYDTARTSVTVTPGAIVTHKLFLRRSGITLSD